MKNQKKFVDDLKVCISFVVKQSTSKTKNNKCKCLFAQIIIVKCPIKFENQSVNDEKAIIKH
jgi:hypothetical protein